MSSDDAGVKLLKLKEHNDDNCGQETLQQNEILIASKQGDVRGLERLLLEKKANVRKPGVYPRDWKYTFEHLIRPDQNGRTALHLAASVGNHKAALDCVKLILQSIQVLFAADGHGSAAEKTRLLLECKDKNGETPLHLAIENRASSVVSCLLDYNANTLAENKHGVEALDLVYQQVPDAMKEVFDRCIKLNADHKSFSINLGPVIGFRRMGTRVVQYSKETQCISLLLNADKWGTALLLHPLIKYYLEIKWKKIHSFFWIAFIFQFIWLLMYAVIFVNLQLNMSDIKDSNCTEIFEDVRQLNCNLEVETIWHVMLFLTILGCGKEVYSAWVLKSAYLTSESLVQIIFIVLYLMQYAFIVSRLPISMDIMASISAVTVILSTILVIFQMGKTPMFGLQVAAFKKVIYSCTPHLPVFFVWFIGFGLAFWAIFYNAEKSWLVGMLAIVAAMGTGELNAQDHLEKASKGPFSIPELIRVLIILLFVIVIVTLYFNLLIGYAVSDIQILKTKAEALQLSNKLKTIYTLESFLVSKCGCIFVTVKSEISSFVSNCLRCNFSGDQKLNHMDAIYVLPPSESESHRGKQQLKFGDMSVKQLVAFKEIAFNNIIRDKEEETLRIQKMMKIIEGTDEEEGIQT